MTWYGDLTPRERWGTVWAIARKDLSRVWIAWGAVTAAALVIAAGILGTAEQIARWNPGPYVWTEAGLTTAYGLMVGLHLLSISLAFAVAWGEEVRKGTIRSLVLYPLDLNDLTAAKFLAAVVTGGVGATLAFLVALTPMFVYGVLPLADHVLICIMGLLAAVAAIAFGLMVAHALMVAWRRVRSPAVWSALSAFLAAVCTKTVSFAILMVLGQALFLRPGSTREEFLAVRAMMDGWSDGIALLSPVHVGGRILGTVLGLGPPGLDLQVVLPVLVVLIPAGFYLGRKVRLDIFFS